MTGLDEVTTVTSRLLRDWPLQAEGENKNSAGRILVVGGNVGMPGGVLLPAEAAMRAGAGKLQVATVESVVAALGVALPEAYVVGLPGASSGDPDAAGADQVVELASECDVALLGPGLMDPESAEALLGAIVPRLTCTVVIDALGMAYLTDRLDGVAHLEGRCVLTPNTKELFTTLGEEEPESTSTPEGLAAVADAVRRLAEATGAVVTSGSETSLVAAPDGRVWLDEVGGQGLAVSGSGDVKAGVLAGLLARRAAPEQAAVWAEHVHGRCGDRLASTFGRRGFMARDIPPLVPQVMSELES